MQITEKFFHNSSRAPPSLTRQGADSDGCRFTLGSGALGPAVG